MNNKFIKWIIIVLVIIILCIIGLLYLLKNQNNVNNDYSNIVNNDNNENIIEENPEKINAKDFCTVSKCVQLYLDAINKTNSNYYAVNDNGEYESNIESDEVKESIYNLLDENYIKKNNISTNNIWKKVNSTNEKTIFIPLSIKSLNNGNVNQYAVYGENINLNYEFLKEIYLIIYIDNTNKTFSVEPVNKQIKNIDEISTENNNSSIKVKVDNSIIEPNINDNYLSLFYFDNFKLLMLSDSKKAYEYFDQDYAQKRFGNVESFTNYIESNREDIIGLRCEKYLVNNEVGYTQYVIQDQYKNYYIFDAKSIMDYTVKLDTYTISTEKFSTTYSGSSNDKRVQMNIDKFFKMINRHDYKTAYSCLATSFKNNYTLTGEKFIEAVKNKFFTYNNVEYVKCDEVGNNTYAYEIKLTDLTGNNQEEKTITIIMKLNDEDNFEMSFDIE